MIVLFFRRSIAMPEDAQFMRTLVPAIHRVYGASSMQRLAIEIGLTEQGKN